MRNYTFPVFLFLFLCVTSLNVFAQARQSRCGSMEALELWFNQNPAAREQYLRNVEQGKSLAETARGQAPTETQRMGAVVYIPVVFHFVLGAADQAKVTKADVLWQLNKMNEDYAGTNADSTNGTAFYSIRGHSQIQFCLAQQDPNGNPTDGINRVYSTITDFSSATVANIKHANSCGANAWDPNRYLNIWVSKSTSLLGIATFPQSGPADEQGVAIALDGFSNNPAYVNPTFALGRTLVHESGHFFGLYHIWGDDGSACTGDDFRQVPGTCLLPASLLIGDTPNQAAATAGCASGVRTDLCTGTAPGINFQNFMDYTDDACYSMFTAKQVERVEYMLMNCRASLLTSNACTPVATFANDASPNILSPGNTCFPGGNAGIFCMNSDFSANVMLTNFGTANLTSATIYAVVGSGAPVSVNYSGNLAQYESTVITIPGINAGGAAGNQVLKIYTSNPNASADQRPLNDTSMVNITVVSGSGTISVTEGFESASFPPSGWTVLNPDPGSITWERTTSARNSGVASAYINFYNYSGATDHLDYLIAPGISVTNADSVVLTFSRAYKQYSATQNDTLMIQISNQCGATTFPITAWKKGGADLATAAGFVVGSYVPAATDWLKERIDLKSYIPVGSNSIVVSFTSKNGPGQNLYIDDVNLRTVELGLRDALIKSIPNARQCSNSFVPTVDIFNNGKDTIKTLRIVYTITGPASFSLTDSVNFTGSLASGEQATVSLKNVNLGTPGQYSIKAYTKLPNGLPDQSTSNDTLTQTFRYVTTLPAPVFQGFESTQFPPPNWSRTNADGLGTWFRTTAASFTGVASAVVDNYNYNANGTNDDLESPAITYSGIDSAFITFRVAHASYLYPGSTGLPLDTLQVFVTKDCGKTLIPVYSKWGEDLQTVNDPNFSVVNLFIPNSPAHWRLETINLTSVFGTTGTAQIVIRNKGNFGNTTLLDDILISTKTLPLKLKQNGYLITPNPFNSSFSVQHYVRPVALRGIQVATSSGQVVYSRNFGGDAQSNINIDLSRYSAGVYLVKLIYNDKVVTERVVKRQ